MTKSRNAPRSKLAGKQASKISRKRTAPRDIREHDTVSAAACEKTGGEASVPAAPAGSSKKATILALLQRPTGAAIGDLTEATGWQGHSVRAALTGLRKEGKELVRVKIRVGSRITGSLPPRDVRQLDTDIAARQRTAIHNRRCRRTS